MPATFSQSYAYSKLEPMFERPDAGYHPVAFKPSQTIVRGTILGQVTATGLYAIYIAANGDGTEVARCIAMYDMVVLASGKVVLGLDITTTDIGIDGYPSAPVYLNGMFDTTKLNVNGTQGITPAVVSGLSGRMFSGLAATSNVSGILYF